jgi:hypothetical protein
MKFTSEQIKELEKFRDFSIETVLPLDGHQESSGTGDGFRCCDWWCLEMVIGLIEGREKYLSHSFSCWKESKGEREQYLNLIEDKHLTFDLLDKVKEEADVLVIGEMARGLEVLLAYFIKDWKKIYVWDNNPFYAELFMKYFKSKNVEWIWANTGNISFNPLTFYTGQEPPVLVKEIKEDVILIMNNVGISDKQFEEIKNNPIFKQTICQGRILSK